MTVSRRRAFGSCRGTRRGTSHTVYHHPASPTSPSLLSSPTQQLPQSDPSTETTPSTTSTFNMLSNNLFLVAAFASSAIATTSCPAPDKYYWTVTGFTSTCTAATCRYDFNVSGATGPLSQPSFDAYGCDGETGASLFEPCATVGSDVPGNVRAKELNLGDRANVFVEFSFEQ